MRSASGRTSAIPIPGATGGRHLRPHFKLGRSGSWSSSNSGSGRSDTSTLSRGSSSGSSELLFGPMEDIVEDPSSSRTHPQHQYLYPAANISRPAAPPDPLVCPQCGQQWDRHTAQCGGGATSSARRTTGEDTPAPLHAIRAPERRDQRGVFGTNHPASQVTGLGAVRPSEGIVLRSRPFPSCHAGPSSGHLPAGVTPAMLSAESFLIGSPPRSFPIRHLSAVHQEVSTRHRSNAQSRAREGDGTREWAARSSSVRR